MSVQGPSQLLSLGAVTPPHSEQDRAPVSNRPCFVFIFTFTEYKHETELQAAGNQTLTWQDLSPRQEQRQTGTGTAGAPVAFSICKAPAGTEEVDAFELDFFQNSATTSLWEAAYLTPEGAGGRGKMTSPEGNTSRCSCAERTPRYRENKPPRAVGEGVKFPLPCSRVAKILCGTAWAGLGSGKVLDLSLCSLLPWAFLSGAVGCSCCFPADNLFTMFLHET